MHIILIFETNSNKVVCVLRINSSIYNIDIKWSLCKMKYVCQFIAATFRFSMMFTFMYYVGKM